MRSERAWHVRLFALLTAMVIVFAACGGDDDDDSGSGGGGTEGTEETGEVPEGGELVIGAEQEPDCVAWIKSLRRLELGLLDDERHDDATRRTTPIPEGDGWTIEFNEDLLTAEPELDDSDPAKPVVTYTINPDAVWSDSTPITCDDFTYTWDAIANGDDIYDTTGYTEIEIGRLSRPEDRGRDLRRAVHRLAADLRRQLRHLPVAPPRRARTSPPRWTTATTGRWPVDDRALGRRASRSSSCPTRTSGATKPKLDKVIFKFQADTAAEFEAFKNGEVAMIYPQPQPDVIDQIQAGLEDAESVYTADTGNLEALWMNNATPPLDDVNVRQAIAYSIDRDAIVEQLFGGARRRPSRCRPLNPPDPCRVRGHRGVRRTTSSTSTRSTS